MSDNRPLPDDLVRDIDRLSPQLALLDHYQVLGVGEAATEAEIKQSYLRLVQRFHPDRWHSRDSGAHQKRMEAIFARVTEAYEVLRHAHSRLEYDRSLYEIRGIPRPSAAPRLAPTAPGAPARPMPPPVPPRAGPPPRVAPPATSPAPASTPAPRAHEARSPSQAKLMAARMMHQLRPHPASPAGHEAPHPPASSAGSPVPAAASAPKVPILVVEDDEALRTMLVRILSDLGEVTATPDGAAALRALEKDPLPRIVVTDVMMPNVDGLELARRMKGSPRLARVPIVILTARQGPKDMIEGVNAGARYYLTKPFKVDELKSKVKKAMGI